MQSDTRGGRRVLWTGMTVYAIDADSDGIDENRICIYVNLEVSIDAVASRCSQSGRVGDLCPSGTNWARSFSSAHLNAPSYIFIVPPAPEAIREPRHICEAGMIDRGRWSGGSEVRDSMRTERPPGSSESQLCA